MEIIHIILGKANPERMNGVNKMVNSLAAEQAQAGLDVSIWGITASTEHNYPQRNYNTVLFKKEKFPFAINAQMEQAIAAQPADTMFHLHGGFVPQMYSISRLLKRCGHKFVFTPHGSYNTLAMQKSKFSKYIYTRCFEKPMLNRASAVHVLGASEAIGMNEWCHHKLVCNIAYGYQLGQLPQCHKDGQRFIIGYCGRIDIFTKGLDALVAGFAEFNKKNANSELWILGDGKETSHLKEAAERAGIMNNIVFHGAKYGVEKTALLAQCHAFAHPSRNEGLPASILEAAALGLPCLVTDATNMGEAIKNYKCGIVVKETTAANVHCGLSELYNAVTKKAEQLSKNARKMVTEQYNWTKLISEYKAMYTNAMAQ